MILQRSFRYAMARLKIQPGRFRSGKWFAGKEEPPRRNYDYELTYFSAGRGRLILDGIAYPCRAGTLLIIPPGAEQRMICERVLERWSFHFDWFGDCRAHWEGNTAFVYTDSGETFDPAFCAAPPPAELGLQFPLSCNLPEKTAEEFLEVLRKYFMLIPVSLVSAQPAPSGFEADSVVCSATNRNNGRTAWDGKDEIIGRRNCQYLL